MNRHGIRRDSRATRREVPLTTQYTEAYTLFTHWEQGNYSGTLTFSRHGNSLKAQVQINGSPREVLEVLHGSQDEVPPPAQ